MVLPAGQNEVSYFIASRIKYLVSRYLLIKKKSTFLPISCNYASFGIWHKGPSG